MRSAGKPAGRVPDANELCAARAEDLDGVSLVPLLKNPKAKWDRPAVTTWGRDNHAVRGQRYRYIRHPNGTEQLYDHQIDPNEFTNLADRPELAAVKPDWPSGPKTNAAPVPNKNNLTQKIRETSTTDSCFSFVQLPDGGGGTDSGAVSRASGETP